MTDFELQIKATFADKEWLRENESRVKELFPVEWTNMRNLDVVRIGYNLTLIGIKTVNPAQLCCVLACIEKCGLVERRMGYVRANPSSLFLEKPQNWKTSLRN